MFECPNCGESVRDDAAFCPHCGSDAETGWNPDAEYLSVDLPDFDGATEEDDEPAYAETEGASERTRRSFAQAVLALCFVLFLAVGFQVHDMAMVIPAIVLAVTAIIVLRPRRPARQKPRRRRPDSDWA